MADPVVTITNGVPTAGTGAITTLGQLAGPAGTPSALVQSVQGVSGGTPVPILDAFQAPVTASWTSATTINTALTLTTSGYDTVILTIVPGGTITAGAIIFEAFDGTNWVTVKAPRTDSYSTDSTFTLTGSPGTHSWQVPVAGYPQFRARLSTALTGTTPTAGLVGIVSSAPDTSIVTVGLDPAQALPAGTNALGAVAVANGANTAAVKAASTAPAATDPALVVAISPNSVNQNGRALPAASAPVVLNSMTYKAVAASATATLLGTTGASGDYLDGVLIVPATAAAGAVSITDGSGTAITIFAGGGTTALPTLAPFYVPISAVSSGGAGGWKVTTGANVSVIGVGNFT